MSITRRRAVKRANRFPPYEPHPRVKKDPWGRTIRTTPKGYRCQITRAQFYRAGGFSNAKLFRRARKNGSWTYWML